MVKINIMVFKESGKYYTDCTVELENDIALYDNKFKQLIIDNLPSRSIDSYIVVTDAPDGDGFHTILYKMSDLLNNGAG